MVYDLRDRKWQKPQPKRVIKPELTPPKHVKDDVEFLLGKAASRKRKAKPSRKQKHESHGEDDLESRSGTKPLICESK
jgi:hypothetical protein